MMTNPRIAIVCSSRHHGNTRRVALAIAEATQASLFTADEEVAQRLERYELVGFGSGIYFGRHDARIRALIAIARLPRKAFVFSTAGLPVFRPVWHRGLRRRLERRGCQVVKEFCCRGWDTMGPLAWIGGINRQRPDARDLEAAAAFGVSLLELAASRASASDARGGDVQRTVLG